MRAEHPAAEQPFTVVVCRGNACGHARAQAVIDGLRASIRRHPHAVLMSADCVLGPVSCHASAVAAQRSGPLLLVQDCTEDRVPQGPAWWVGPVTDPEDIAAVRHWLDNGHPHTAGLPPHLYFRSGATAARN